MIATETEIKLSELYETVFPAVASFVAKLGGSAEDAKDIFHDAIIIFLEKEEKVDNASAYVVGIAKHLWVRKFKHDKNRVELDHSIQIPEEEQQYPLPARLYRLVEQAGRSCLELLQAFYYEKQSAENIASQFNYSNAHSATVQKHKCLQKIKNFIKERSIQYESFFE